MEGYSSDVALFQKPLVEEGIESYQFVEYRPSSTLSEGSSFEFHIPGSGALYTDWSTTRLVLKVRMLQADGSPPPNPNTGAPVNLTLQSLFRQVDVLVGGKNITSEVGINYPYKAIMDIILFFGMGVKESELQSEMYFKDTGSMDAVPPGNNSGLMTRAAYFGSGSEVQITGPLKIDLSQQSRLLLNGVPVIIKMFPSNNNFVTMSPSETPYKLVITEASLKVRHAKMNPKIILAHNEALNHGEALYPYWKSNVKAFSIPAGVSSYSIDDLYNGMKPSRLIIAMVGNAAYTGDSERNPFNFRHYMVNFIQFTVDGNSVPEKAFQPDFGAAGYTDAYYRMFFDKYPEEGGNFITLEDFQNGYAFFCFNLDGQGTKDVMVEQKHGQCRLEMSFAAALAESVTLIAYSQFPSMFKVDKTRNVTLI